MKRATALSLSRLPQWVRAHIANLETDKARLDWLEAHPFTAYRSIDPETGKPEGHTVLVDESKALKGGRRGIVRNTLRECIDEATTGTVIGGWSPSVNVIRHGNEQANKGGAK